MTITGPARPSTAAPAGGFGPRFLVPLVLGTLLNAINSSMIAVTLAPIGHDLGAGAAETVWLVTVLYLATAVAQPVMGRLVDRCGARRVLLTGLWLVCGAGVLGTLAGSLPMLIAVRVLLGLGTATGFPAAMAIVRARANTLGVAVPGGVLATLATSTQASMAIGPTLGALLAAVATWRATFAVNVPIALLGIVLAVRWLPADGPRTRSARERVDVTGVVLFAVALVALLLFMLRPEQALWPSLAVGLLLSGALVWWELRAADPFLDLRALGGNGPLVATYLRQALAYLAIYAFLYGYPQWLAQSDRLPETTIGLALLPMSVTTVTLSALGTRLGLGVWSRLLLTGGALFAGALALLLTGAGTAMWLLVAIGFLFGVGQGLSTVANQTALYVQAPAERIGTLSGLFRTSQYLGALASTSVIALSFGERATDSGLGTLALVLLVTAALLLCVTGVDRGLRRVPTH
ncbi:MFS transporter [Amycolatopsis cihanbeyliensis]|uniref:MFS transporter n=1 Tax=Amycolatopsis cihanbeyliensis TaxID=1128664 RepID=A0A542DHR7_AMYCI|nr:MFS transporter [Amycolatopsis cihanbeyliensis]TQJ02623.1 MFS transporter [Amycolatopsis cihanbeyliensis]